LALESCSAAGRRRNRRLNPGTATTRGGYRMRTDQTTQERQFQDTRPRPLFLFRALRRLVRYLRRR
jgi:hypothetical protein